MKRGNLDPEDDVKTWGECHVKTEDWRMHLLVKECQRSWANHEKLGGDKGFLQLSESIALVHCLAAKLCLTLCNPMGYSMPVLHYHPVCSNSCSLSW